MFSKNVLTVWWHAGLSKSNQQLIDRTKSPPTFLFLDNPLYFDVCCEMEEKICCDLNFNYDFKLCFTGVMIWICFSGLLISLLSFFEHWDRSAIDLYQY